MSSPGIRLTFHHLQVDVVLQVCCDMCHLSVQAQAGAQQVVKLGKARVTLELGQRTLDLNLDTESKQGRPVAVSVQFGVCAGT